MAIRPDHSASLVTSDFGRGHHAHVGADRSGNPLRVIAQDVGDDDLRTLSREQPGSPQFVGLLAGVVLIMGGLAYFPAVSLGPVTEQVAMNRGTHFPVP